MWDNVMFLIVLGMSGIMIAGVAVVMVLSYIGHRNKEPKPMDEYWDKFI